MDKGWMRAPRWSVEYDKGLSSFIEFAFTTSADKNRILCPCRSCGNNYWLEAEHVRDHLISVGFMDGYTTWIHHGEGMWSSIPSAAPSSQSEEGTVGGDAMDQMLMEGFGMYDSSALGADGESEDEMDVDAEAYYKLVNDASQELYPNCKGFSKLQFLVRVLNWKNLWRVSDGCYDDLLGLIKDALPEGEVLPKNFHEAKKFVKAIGIGYKCIDACKNDCILFRKEYANAKFCPVCKSSRWKSVKGGEDGRRIHRVPAKVVRHFPLKKRLQRLFMSSKTARDMRWHSESRTKDGFLRHPADSPAWKNFDAIYPQFSLEDRNVRLGLATDGFNPFGNMNVSYSIWPIILIPYNLPPWVCMKQSNFILSVLVPGKKSPGKDIDIYMQLTIDDLLELWKDGVMTYDVSCSEKFRLRVALLWTISGWLGRGILSGESIAACSHYLMDTSSLRLQHGHKTCYMCHRRFLDPDHKFRFQARLFDGTQELRESPIQLSGKEISQMTKDIRSCLFQLPYWETLLVRNNLDVMHIEKNVYGNIFNTFLDVDKRSKDNLNARLDLQKMGIRPDLHPHTEGSKSYLPPALYSLSPQEKRMFCQLLKETKFPTGYASNLHNKVLVEEKRLVGLKTHDCHIIMCDLLPLAVSRILPARVSMPLVRLSHYFKKLYSKVICVSEIERLEAEILEILCQLEKIFPPSFFDIMVHLTVHLATEIRLAGPVHYRNMYSIERLLCKYKSMVRTRSHPEGSIAEGCQLYENCVEVLVSIVFNQTTMLPRAHGKIQKLGSATARCILWPRQNVCSGTKSQVSLNRRDIVRVKRSTSKDDPEKEDAAKGRKPLPLTG
ncbi:hypothetical protein U9M48_013539 [Paspalum notatum var. saurae]|uniref:Transposase n=1 Tax=Paspalum notatum var. saurae TaxID=547442 RepID=A0AAQ3T0L3_PASNO